MNPSQHSIAHSVFEYCKEQIQNGVWSIGEKIPSENQLATTMNVSRSSVRTALQTFIAHGILQSQQGKGTILLHNNLSVLTEGPPLFHFPEAKGNFMQALSFRQALEVRAIGIVMKKNNLAPFLGELHSLLGGMMQAGEQPALFVEKDLTFHFTIVKQTENPFFIQGIIPSLTLCYQKQMEGYTPLSGQKALYYHTIILKCIENGDIRAAQQMMNEHFQKAIEAL